MSQLGSGSFGVTWRAEDTRDPNRVAAIKAVWMARLDGKARALLDREVAVLATLCHPDLPTLHESFDTGSALDRRRWLVQAFIPGPTLRQEMAATRYSLPEVLAILAGVLEILTYLHELRPPVIHRDIKPENLIRRTDTGRWALIDFGSVRDCCKGTLGGSTVAGTFEYMAPEQFMGEASPATDLWALGVLGVELLSRRPLRSLRKDQWTFAWDAAVGAPAEVKAWLGRMLAPDPERRASSARVVLAEVTRLLRVLPGGGQRSPPSEPEPGPLQVRVPEIGPGRTVASKVESLLELWKQRDEAERRAAEELARAGREQHEREARADAEKRASEAMIEAKRRDAEAGVARRAEARQAATSFAVAAAQSRAEACALRDWAKVAEFLKVISNDGATWDGNRRVEGLEAVESWLADWGDLPPVEVEGERFAIEIPRTDEIRLVAAFLRGERSLVLPDDPAPGTAAAIRSSLVFSEREEDVEEDETYVESVVVRRFLGIPTKKADEPRTRKVARMVKVPDVRPSGVSLCLRWCPPGRFLMGNPVGEAERHDHEDPQREVHLTHGFWIGETPVTQAQYEAVMRVNPSDFDGDPCRPVENVTWCDAVAFCEALSRMVGAKFRLPTGAEWEYACRAGTSGTRYGELDDIAWHHGNSGGTTHPVGEKLPNAWGLYDTLGNVWEWTVDARTGDSRGAARSIGPSMDPTDPGSAGFMCCGGSWASNAMWCRAASRDRGLPWGLGFRVLMPPTPSLP